VRKIGHLENEKKIISDNLQIKVQELERLKAEAEEKMRSLEPTPYQTKI
jgi:butyrate kinase